MEVLKLSRFKLQLHALVTEVRQLRVSLSFAFSFISLSLSHLCPCTFQEREHFATEQLTLSNQVHFGTFPAAMHSYVLPECMRSYLRLGISKF